MPVRTYSRDDIAAQLRGRDCFETRNPVDDEWILAGDAHFMDKAEARSEASLRARP